MYYHYGKGIEAVLFSEVPLVVLVFTSVFHIAIAIDLPSTGLFFLPH